MLNKLFGRALIVMQLEKTVPLRITWVLKRLCSRLQVNVEILDQGISAGGSITTEDGQP